MRIYVQWSTSTARGWEAYDSSQWATLPVKPLPVRGEVIDDALGWVTCLNVQGVEFTGDHYAVLNNLDGSVTVYCWNDDPDDLSPSLFRGQIWTFREPAFDPAVGTMNTRQSQLLYLGSGLRRILPDALQNTVIDNYISFVPPREAVTKHGVWMADLLNEAHEASRNAEEHGWEEHIPGGGGHGSGSIHLGTITFLFRAPATTDSDCTPISNFNQRMHPTTQFVNTLQVALASGTDELTHAFTTEANNPNDADWPAASVGAPYLCSINATQVGGDVSFGLLTLGASNGRFARVNSSCTEQESWTQGESAFTGNGVKVATNTSIDPAAGAASDRYQVIVAALRAASMGNQNFSIRTTTAAFADWPENIPPDEMSWYPPYDQTVQRDVVVRAY